MAGLAPKPPMAGEAGPQAGTRIAVVQVFDKPSLSEADQRAFFMAMLAATRTAQALQPEAEAPREDAEPGIEHARIFLLPVLTRSLRSHRVLNPQPPEDKG